MMKLGFNQATCMMNSTLEQDIQLAESYGYDVIELRLDMLTNYLQQHDISELAAFFATSHLQPYGYNSLEDITFCDPESWREKRDQLAFACNVASTIGGDCLVVVPTIRAGLARSQDEVIKDSVKRLREMSDYAGEHGMRLAFEPIGSAHCCVRSLPLAMEIVDAVDRSNVGLVVDAFNLFLFDQWQDPTILRQVPTEKIFVYHIDDSDDLPVDKLDHCHRLFPGNGIIPLTEISRQLASIHYTGPCSLELFNPGYWRMEARDVFEIGANKTRPFLNADA
ncbi:sugar phosphate isomerase/epimerase family protein [Brenneria goodwinii]